MTPLRADLLDFVGAPAWGETDTEAVRWRPDHRLWVDDAGRIARIEPAATPLPPGVQEDDQRGRLLLPGFIDTHVHSAQIPVLASYGTELLGWLERYTFPAEQAWADGAVAAQGSAMFLDALLAHGTTTAAVFPTVHRGGCEALFAAAEDRGMALVAGKVLMDRHAPPALCDTAAQGQKDSADLAARWHGRGRARYAVTLRFAPTSTPEQLAAAGELLQGDPSLYFQTHLAETQDEVGWVARLYPQARSYLDVYASAGLMHRRSFFAHGIWLDDPDRSALAEAGATVVHCPGSNTFLGSGLFDWAKARAQGLRVSLASDVGGGTHLSMQRNAAEAYRVQALRGQRLTAWVALHAATLGAAEALDLSEEIGRLEPGCFADFTLWDWHQGAVETSRQAAAQASGDLHERVFAWMMLSDERHLVGTWVAGRPALGSTATAHRAGGRTVMQPLSLTPQ
jgi:guanine deaminase